MSAHKSSYGDKKMIKHGHAYSIAAQCPPELAGGIILGCDVKAVESYVMVNFEFARS